MAEGYAKVSPIVNVLPIRRSWEAIRHYER